MSPAPAAPPKAATKPVVTKKSFAPLKPQEPRPRIVVYGPDGIGKTSIAVYAKKVRVLSGRDESGVQRLADSGRMPDGVPVMSIDTWDEFLSTLADLANNPGDMQTLAIDSLSSFERLCDEKICSEKFKGDWGKHGWANYGDGPRSALPEFIKMLAALDRINKKGITVILIGHAAVKEFKNPEGSNFDRYVCNIDLTHKWPAVRNWADAVYFYRFVSVVVANDNKLDEKGKGIGGAEREICTQRRDAFDAKPGYAVPEVIKVPDDHTQVYDAIFNAINGKE